jgi:type II secretory pathway component GspD/PulD (secretin)
MTRKDFITLTFTLIGSGVALATCSDNDNHTNTGIGGTNGTAGTTGTGGHAGTTGSGGQGGTTGSAGTTGSGGSGTSACTDPLPETKVPDQTGHSHTVTIMASALDATSPQTFNTSVTLSHMHMITLAIADLAAIKAGGMATVTSTPSPIDGHFHMFTVTCH